jgi:multicomponent Na+:H+ antiporter subunit A
MLLVVLSGFLVALLLLFVGKQLKENLSMVLTLLPLSLCVYFISLLPRISAGERLVDNYSWIPSMGINLDFTLDGLSMVFCLLITGIGTLIFWYASSYLKGHHYLDRFYGYLCMFMGAMLGLVLSDNVLSLFVFWELTSITSFFLIGFNNDSEASRKSSLLALSITGGGGFLLMAGFILMGSIVGTYSIVEMLQQSSTFEAHALYPLLLFLVCSGAFTKSAQFPFHFWLPGAMKAPTPVSAYLHSATMVKAGVYLLARLSPVLGNHLYWHTTLMIAGGITMLYAAFHSIIRTDLKGILAYSTIAALGMLVFLIGIGTQEAFTAAAVFILVHALYKAALFLVTGVIDHETGTRDVTRLSGLGKVMLPLAVAGFLAALSGGGIPLTFGFIGKDLIYEATLGAGMPAVTVTGAALFTNILLLYAGFVAGIKPFTGRLPEVYKDVHLPPAAMWFPPLLLSLGSLFLGLFPGVLDASVAGPVVLAISGAAENIHLKIWHGFNFTLLLSAITLMAGIGLYFALKPSYKWQQLAGKLDVIAPEQIIAGAARGVERFSYWYTQIMHNGYLRLYVLTIVVFLTGLLAFRFFNSINFHIDSSYLSDITVYEATVSGVMLLAIVRTVYTSSRLTAVASMGVVGYCLCLLFVFYSAPDLAMTQFTIDTLTVVLFVLVLFKLPPFINSKNRAIKIRDGIVALAFGVIISLIALEVLDEPVNKEISHFYAENSYIKAKGKNVVNVILVDFRGIDTMVEISVLTIAAIGVYSLLKLKIDSAERE